MPSDTLIQKVSDWIYFFHPQDAPALAVTRYVVNQVYPTTARRQRHQLGFLPGPFGRYIQIIPREGLYQFSAFTGSEHWEKDQETGTHRLPREPAEQYCPTPDDLLGRYVKTLIQHTMRRTPLRVAGALGTFLWHYSAPDIRCLLPDARDWENLAHHRAALLQTIIDDRFPCLATNVTIGPHGARTVCTKPPSKDQRQLIKAALWTVGPWWIPHVSLSTARSDNEQIHTFICPGCRGFNCASMARSDNAQHHPFPCPRTPSPQCCNNTPPHLCGGFAEVIHQYNAGLPRGATMLDHPDDRLRIPDFQTPSAGSPSDEDPGGSEPASSGGTPLPIASRLQPPPLTPEQIDSVRADARHQRHRRRHYRRGLLHIYVDGTRRPDVRPGQPFMVSSHASSVEVFGRDAEGDLLLAVFPLPDLETLQAAPVPQLSVKYRWGHALQLGIQPVRKAPGAIPEGRLQLTHRESPLAPVFEWIEQGWRLSVVRYACVALLAAVVGGALGKYAPPIAGTSIAPQLDTIATLREQNHALVKQLDDGPVVVGFKPVDQRTLQLHLSLYPNTVQAIFVYWGDLTDRQDGTRIYPVPGVKVAPGIRVADRLLLPPITHEYPPGPPEGVTTRVRIRVVPALFKGEPPKARFAPLRFSSEENLSPTRLLRILPERIVVDSPQALSEMQLMSPSQSQPDGVARGEPMESGLLQKLNDAQGYLEGGSPNGSTEAVRLYQEVLEQLSPRALQQLNEELLKAANKDAEDKRYIDQAARKYQAVFRVYQPKDP